MNIKAKLSQNFQEQMFTSRTQFDSIY